MINWKLRSSTIIRVLAVYALVLVTLAGLLNALGNPDPHGRARVLMGVSMVYVWVVGFGCLSYWGRERFSLLFRFLPGPWQLKFVSVAATLALLEEVIVVTLTNLAPLFGSTPEKAFITASVNYLYVIAFSSVLPLIIPWIIAWAVLLTRYAFPPNHVFLIFGLIGSLAEATVSIDALIGGVWFLVYGLMVYLPAYAIPKERSAATPRLRHYCFAIVLPVLFAAPVMALATTVREALGITFFTDHPS